MRMDDRTRGVGLGLLALAAYLRTLCPTVYEGDSGELLSAVATLGVSHPTGFPLYMLATRLAMLVIPLGDAAHRANLVSALFAAGTVGVTWFSSRALGTGRAASASAALFLAFAATLWSHATAARVYSMTAFFLAALLYAAIRWLRDRNERWFTVAGVLLGLGLGTHTTILLAVPALVVLIAMADRASLRSRALLRGALVAAGIAVSLYLYIPLAARRDPAMNWSEPRGLASLAWYLTQREYASIMGLVGARESASVAGEAARGAFREFTPLGFALAAAGAWALWKRERAFLLACATVAGGNVILLMNYGYAAIGEVFPIHRYFYPTYLVMALWIGAGVDVLVGAMARGRVSGASRRDARTRTARTAPAVTALALLLPVVPLIAHARAADRSRNVIVRDYGANLLASVPRGGLLFTKGDAVSGSVWYLQIVEHERSDVIHLQRDLLGQDWYARQMIRRHPGVVPPDLAGVPPPDRWLRVADANLGARAVMSTSLAAERYRNVPRGLLVQFLPPDAPPPDADAVARGNDELWRGYATTGVLDPGIHKDVMVREMVRFYSKGHVNLGVFYADAGREDDAAREYQESLRYDGENAAALYNLGNLLVARGDAARGRPLIDRASELARAEGGPEFGVPPDQPGGLSPASAPAAEDAVRAGIEYGRAGDHAHAIGEFRRALAIDSLFVPAWLSLGTACLNNHAVDEAIASYERAIQLEPGPLASIAYLNLGMIYAQARGNPPRAREYLQRFVDLNPSDPRVEAIRGEIARLSAMPATGRGALDGGR